jgi:hypothetical protein
MIVNVNSAFGLGCLTKRGVSLGCATCLLACGVQVWSSKAVVNDEGEGQAGLCRWTKSGEGQMSGLGLRDWRSRVTNRRWLILGVIDKCKST